MTCIVIMLWKMWFWGLSLEKKFLMFPGWYRSFVEEPNETDIFERFIWQTTINKLINENAVLNSILNSQNIFLLNIFLKYLFEKYQKNIIIY